MTEPAGDHVRGSDRDPPGDHDPTGGLPLDAFDAVGEFAAEVRAGTVEDGDREVRSTHSLAILFESILEVLSKTQLSVSVTGLTIDSEAALKGERSTLEQSGGRAELQRLLYRCESLCECVRDAGYTPDDQANDRFFRDLFPDWLRLLRAWALAEGHPALAAKLADEETAYSAVEAEILRS